MLSKKNKGITLVALVITIIILLILAGISISALTNTGIFGKAKDAKSKSELADAQEKITLLEHEWQMESASNTNATLGEFLAEKVKDKTIDSYEALISDRVYRHKFTREEAISIMQTEKEHQPDVMQLLKTMRIYA